MLEEKHPMLDRKLIQHVLAAGWHVLPLPRATDCFAEDLLCFSRRLGNPLLGRKGEAVESLRPQSSDEAHPCSLSALHGPNQFPLHSDGAHRFLPPQFVVLACRCAGSRSVPTILVRFADIQMPDRDWSLCEGTPFLVSNGRRSFYMTIVQSARKFVRFDMGCMTPASAAAADVRETVRQKLDGCESVAIDWREGDVLIIDNWNVLHGRGVVDDVAPSNRHLCRVSIQ
ncbi:MAG: TauD/TfdA family dioxygenase [Rhizobiales bacterium]|nr:TauD/TfdA family dioxygenase [Hyphomicrobiales bacterium]